MRLEPRSCAMACRFYGFDGSSHYELAWDYGISHPTQNVNGISGRARVISCSGGGHGTGEMRRVHSCNFNLCRAVYPDSKYTLFGPPMHVQASSWRPLATSAEPADPPVAEVPVSAVAEVPVSAAAEVPDSAVAEVPVSAVAEPPPPALATPPAPATPPPLPPPAKAPPPSPPQSSPSARLRAPCWKKC